MATDLVRPAGVEFSCEHLARAVMEASDEGVIIMGLDGVVHYANSIALKYLARKSLRADVVRVFDLDFPPLYEYYQAALRSPSETFQSRVIIPATAEEGDLRVKAIESPTGVLTGAVAFLRDCSYEHSIEQIRSDFLSTVSHELRTPLTSILGYTSLLADGGDSIESEDRRNFLGTIEKQGRILLELINDLLEVTRLEAGTAHLSPEVYDVTRIMEAVFLEYDCKRDRPDVSIEFERPRNAILGYCDPSRVQQALGHLMDNALKFTSEGGHINLVIQTSENEVLLSVVDDGVGIPENKQERVFDKFYQVDNGAARSSNGTGLGLPIVKRIAEMHGGRVLVESQPGKGSRFTFTVPRAVAGQQSQDSLTAA